MKTHAFQVMAVFRRFSLLAALLTATSAQADPLPWLEQKLTDPFAMEKKASSLVDPSLKPDSCQVPDMTRKLSLNEVVISSICNNPDTKASYLSLVSQAATYYTNYAGYMPNVAYNASHGAGTTYGYNSKVSAVSSSYGLSLGLTLYDFGQREFKLETAELALASAGHTYNSTLQGTIASALQGYYALLNAQNALKVAYQSEEFSKESFDAAKLRHQIGQVPLADELQAKNSYSQAQLGTESSQNALALQQAALAQLMGFPPATPIIVADIDDKTLAKDPFGSKLDALMEKAKDKRYDLQASREALKSSEVSLKALQRSDLATITATTNLAVANDNIHLFNYNNTRSQAIGVNVSIPIFTGFSSTYTERAAEKSLDAQRETLITTERNVEKDVWNSWHNYETAKQSWVTSEDQIASAVELREVSLGRYKEGLGSILDVLNAQLQYSSALQSQLQTRYNLLTTRVDLVRSVGVLDLESINPETTLDTASVKTPMLD